MSSLHADATSRGLLLLRENSRDERDARDSILLGRFGAKTTTRDKFDESVRLTRFHDLHRDANGACYMRARALRRAGGKMVLSHQVSPGDAFTSSNAKRQRQVRDGERLNAQKHLEARPRTARRDHPRVPFSHLFPFISIYRRYSPRGEKRRGKSGNNGKSPRVDRNGSSPPSKGFSRENLAVLKGGSTAKIVVNE